jgi:hypothetical protein
MYLNKITNAKSNWSKGQEVVAFVSRYNEGLWRRLEKFYILARVHV